MALYLINTFSGECSAFFLCFQTLQITTDDIFHLFQLAYQIAYEDVILRTLQVSVWSYNALEENEFLGATHIPLKDLELGTQTVSWFPLQNLHHVTLMS